MRLIVIFWLFSLPVWAQRGLFSGRIHAPDGKALEGVHVIITGDTLRMGTVSDAQGEFSVELPPGTYRVLFSHLGYKEIVKTLQKTSRPVRWQIVMQPAAENIPEVEISTKWEQTKTGAVRIPKKILQITPVLSGGVKDILLSLPSVSQLDELSSRYLVRGGNYDENAVFINGIEIKRPYLPRSGRQEGLSVINTDLIDNIRFYAGGFPVDKGDKLSSVLEITYRLPRRNAWKLNAGLTGGSLTRFAAGNKSRFAGSFRYRNNTLLLKNLQSDAEYHPVFADLQTFWHYTPHEKWTHEWINYLSWNTYRFVPHAKQVNFGTFADAKALVIYYEGREKDRFYSQFSGWRSVYRPDDTRVWVLTASLFHTAESEYFDIAGSYFLGEPDTDLESDTWGDPINLKTLGQQLDHARNDLDAVRMQGALSFKKHAPGSNVEWHAGTDFSYEDIRDRIKEYRIIDSAGFSLLPPASEFRPEEPYVPDTLPLLPFAFASGDYHTAITRIKAFVLMRYRFKTEKWQGRIIPGFRTGYWQIRNFQNDSVRREIIFSPRVIFFLRPLGDRRHSFRLTAGLYMQPPQYREFRDYEGNLRLSVSAQKAWNFSLAHEMGFQWKDIPFRISSEIYFRRLYDVNPYKIENLRIRYAARNNATAYAAGIETRIYAELLPDTPSWLSLALMKTEENIDHRGFIPRPTDQRFKLGLLFQDYVPGMPYLKMYLNNVFATGMPTGAPFYADPYQFRFRTRNYWRTDVGLYYDFTADARWKKRHPRLRECSVGLEILNMFDRRNAFSYLWVREIYSKTMLGVPNYMTGRIFNVRIKMEWP